MKTTTTRRQFIKGVGGAALGVAVASELSYSAEDVSKSTTDEACTEESSYANSDSSTLIFACSGAADVGEISDRVARKMMKEGLGKMYCLAGVGGHVEPILKTTKEATELIAIDGCTAACATKVLKHAGFEPKTFGLKELGFAKGKSPADEKSVEAAFAKIKDTLE